MNFKFRFIVIFILLLYATISCQLVKEGDIKQNQFQVVSIKETHLDAMEIAKKWSQDALLFRIDAEVYLPNSRNSKNELIYIFESPTNHKSFLRVICTSYECNSQTNDLFTSFIDMRMDPISIDGLEIDTFDATQIAISNSGDEYLDSKEAFGRMILGRDIDGTYRWLAFFGDRDVGSINIYIDPFNGNVLKIEK